MRIMYIWDADYPWDVRVEKICKSLVNNGHEVHIASRNLKKMAEYENIDGLHIHRIKAWNSSKLNYFLSFPLFFSPVWKRFLDRIIRENSVDVVIVRDLPMTIAGIWAGRRNKIPVILDMAEDYVSLVKGMWKARKFHGFNLIVRNPYLAKLVELYAFKNIDHVIVVVEEAIDVVKRVNKDMGVTIVSNTPVRAEIQHSDGAKSLLKKISNKYSVIYTGGITLGRGIQTVIEAIPEIVDKIPDFQFVVVGDGYASRQLQQASKDKGLSEYVLWVGWVDHEELSALISESKVGIIPHYTSDHVNTTIPNKIFDYMARGLAVISSDAIPMKRILEEEKCGVAFKSGSSADLADAVIKLYNSDFDWGAHGINAVNIKYNWEQDEKRLLKAIECVV